MGMASVTNSITAVVGGHLAPASQASISLFDFSTTNAAPIFQSDETTPVAQPVITDAKGNFAFFVAAGKYTLQIQRATVIEMIDVTFADPDGGGGGIPDAPADGSPYGRQDNAWTVVAGTIAITSGTKFNTGRTIDGDVLWGLYKDVGAGPNAGTSDYDTGIAHADISRVYKTSLSGYGPSGTSIEVSFVNTGSTEESVHSDEGTTNQEFHYTATGNRSSYNIVIYMEWTEI